MGRTVNNSYFEKNERYIVGMYTQHPELAPQYYSLVERSQAGTMRSSHFTFDGQIFSRTKKAGGNKASSWNISGSGLTRKEIKELNSYEDFKKFFGHFFNIVQSPHISTPIIVSSEDIIAMREKLQNDFK